MNTPLSIAGVGQGDLHVRLVCKGASKGRNTGPVLPRTLARSSVFESDWDFGSALGIMGKAKRKTRSPLPASFASTINVTMVHCAILLTRVFRLAIPFFFFVYRRMRFLILGRSVGLKKKKPKKKSQEVSE